MKTLTFAGIAVALVGVSYGHPGGLDANGGHHDRKSGTYHVHRAPSAPAPQSRPANVTPRSTVVSSESSAPISQASPGSSISNTSTALERKVAEQASEITALRTKIEALESKLYQLEARFMLLNPVSEKKG